MSAVLRPAGELVVPLPAEDDFEGWRAAARQVLRAGIAPDRIVWRTPASAQGNLFADAKAALPGAMPGAGEPRASRAFMELARKAALHSDPARFDLLYRLLWRLQRSPRLMEDGADEDVRAINDLARGVRRDIHKMRAFVRFRAFEDGSGTERFVAWFEPEHHILRANARFFTDRFAQMDWAILAPRGSIRWDGTELIEGPPARREDAPAEDDAEDLWRTYYASIFNPARLKIGAMVKEMPRRYWKNLPEAALIPALVAGAQAREASMVQKGALDFGERPGSLSALAGQISACRRCAIGCNGTQAVMGEGPDHAEAMIVGEQPGDREEETGRPFVGPAGQILRAAMQEAGIAEASAYVTNAVKHFKFVPRGKRRLHQTPTAGEIDTCRWWLEGERALVKPRLVLALGASAARAMLGKTVSVQKERGRPRMLEDGSELWITVHPSYLLRLPDDARAAERARFDHDLRAFSERIRQIGERQTASSA